MRTGESYRLKSETLGITMNGYSPRATVMIPKDSVVTLVAGPLDGERLIDVFWKDLTIMIFTQDLRDRAELVDGVLR